MHRPLDPTRLTGRSVYLSTDRGEVRASIRAVGPAGVSLDVDGEAVLLRTRSLGRLRTP